VGVFRFRGGPRPPTELQLADEEELRRAVTAVGGREAKIRRDANGRVEEIAFLLEAETEHDALQAGRRALNDVWADYWHGVVEPHAPTNRRDE
jgi:hypothetical protein